jgi:hypothetical protein
VGGGAGALSSSCKKLHICAVKRGL